MEFDWDDANTAHVRAHGVEPSEVEEVLNSNPEAELVFVTEDGEERYNAAGFTKAGRELEVKFTNRHEKLRPITAFPKEAGHVTKQERKYGKTSNRKRNRNRQK